jgi:hypothetical protein
MLCLIYRYIILNTERERCPRLWWVREINQDRNESGYFQSNVTLNNIQLCPHANSIGLYWQ